MSKTPGKVRSLIDALLDDLGDDLLDLTPRRLMRHKAATAFLRAQLPDIPNPLFMDLHPSLANLDHLNTMILHKQKLAFPCGTDWAGLFPTVS